jgi:hypothetical protein
MKKILASLLLALALISVSVPAYAASYQLYEPSPGDASNPDADQTAGKDATVVTQIESDALFLAWHFGRLQLEQWNHPGAAFTEWVEMSAIVVMSWGYRWGGR